MAMSNTNSRADNTAKFEVVERSKSCVAPNARPQDLDSLWKSGLSGSLMFSVTDPVEDPGAEVEAQNIVARHLERRQNQPFEVAMSEMVDFQRALQMRSKVVSAIEMLMRG